MKLNLQQIRQITQGAIRVTEEVDGVHFYRFSESEERVYRGTDFERKAPSTAGIGMEFDTDGKRLTLAVSMMPSTSRYYFACDVFVNDEYLGSIQNFEDGGILGGYTEAVYPQGDFEGNFDLGEGKKRVRIVFPWSVMCVLREMTLSEATDLAPVKPSRRMLLYGDSITHGYDALHPSGSYASRLARALGYEGFNKAMAADMFRPALAEAESDVEAQLVTVAYGTNDWSHIDADTFRVNCKGFLQTLCERQKKAKIFVITPIWRKDHGEPHAFGDFETVERILRDICATLPVTVIRGYDLVPHDTDNFGDGSLHPNLRGFEQYFNNLLAEMKKFL